MLPNFVGAACLHGRHEYGGVLVTGFKDLVRRAAAYDPYPYQERIAAEGFPDLINVPTGSGKTAASVLPWLFRLLNHPDESVRRETPRRLIVVLPTRALVEQTGAEVHRWLVNLGLAEHVGVHVMMGGQLDQQALRSWRANMHQPTVVIGTVDMVLSRLLFRGYGVPRGSYPIDAALVSNGSQIVLDEIQLAQQSATTLRQIAAFQRDFGTAEPVGITFMSATVDERILDTVDNPTKKMSTIALDDADRSSALAQRLAACRTIKRIDDEKPKLAELAVDQHEDGSLTLVIVNTVERAVDTFKKLQRLAHATQILLLHSRFRGVERASQMGTLNAMVQEGSPGGIVVSTQVVEAGVDIDARTLITEAAPWSSIVQRVGRCNRSGKLADGEATVWWTDSDKKGPYDDVEVSAAQSVLASLEAQSLTSEELLSAGAGIPEPDLVLRVLRRREMLDLFDTTPDLAGADVDIQPFIRDDDDRDVQMTWVDDAWLVSLRERAAVPLPPEPWRCSVSIVQAKKFLERDGVDALVFDPVYDSYVDVGNRRLKPQDLVLVSRGSGGYDLTLGFDRASKSPVQVLPEITTSKDVEGDRADNDPGAQIGEWVSLTQHLSETRAHIEGLVSALSPTGFDDATLRAAVVAAYLHDLGKAHPAWQSGLLAAGGSKDSSEVWAKSGGGGRLIVRDANGTRRRGFRHELMSVYLLGTEDAASIIEELGVPRGQHAVVRYLVGAHHGFLRLSARDPRRDGRTGGGPFGVVADEILPDVTVAAHTFPATQTSLELFHGTRPGGWSEEAHRLLKEFGPFRLAYLEALVRMADWRASGNYPVVGGAA